MFSLPDYKTWSVSSSKPGYGIDQLLDSRLDQLWQFVPSLLCSAPFCSYRLPFALSSCRSEGPQPHLISVQFRKRMPICVRHTHTFPSICTRCARVDD